MNPLIARAGAMLIGVVVLTGCSGSVIPVPTQGHAQSGSRPPCELALITGRLVADARWGIALDDPAGFVREVIWPHGFAARRDARLVLVNAAGQVIAGEGDHVTIGGGEVSSDGPWMVCGTVEVVPGD